MNKESALNKIKKLLALSADNPSDEESHAALQKAQELMAIHKLSEQDISPDEIKKKCIKKKTNFSYGTRSSDHYVDDLAGIIADNFCCVNYISTPRYSKTHYVCFMGMEEDVAICEEAMNIANYAIIKGYNRVYNDIARETGLDYVPARIFNPAKKGYVKGYLAGLKRALESQREKHQEWGLVLVVPQEAQDYIGSLDSVSFNMSDNKVDTYYYDEGYNDGSNFNMYKKVEGEDIPNNLLN